MSTLVTAIHCPEWSFLAFLLFICDMRLIHNIASPQGKLFGGMQTMLFHPNHQAYPVAILANLLFTQNLYEE